MQNSQLSTKGWLHILTQCMHTFMGLSYGAGAWKDVSQMIWRYLVPFQSLGLPDGETTESASGIWPGAIQESSRRAAEPWQWTKAQVWAQPSLSDRPAQCSLFLPGLPCWPRQVLPNPEPPEVSLFSNAVPDKTHLPQHLNPNARLFSWRSWRKEDKMIQASESGNLPLKTLVYACWDPLCHPRAYWKYRDTETPKEAGN